MAVEAFVFDIGNVLVEWNPVPFYDARIGRERRVRFFDETGIEAMNVSIDAGAPFEETVAAHAEAHPAWAEQIALWESHWQEMFRPAIPHSVRLFRALKARGVPVYALTNFGVGTFERALGLYPFLGEFDHAFVSGRLKAIKPGPEIYAALEGGVPEAPEALLFADDSEANVAAARARGWQAHHFTSPAGLASRLVSEGLLTEAEAA